MTKYIYNTEEVSSIHKTDSITDNITIIIFYSYNIDQDMGVETLFPSNETKSSLKVFLHYSVNFILV